MARRAREAAATLREQLGTEPTGCFDLWYADDGQTFCRPAQVDDYLRSIDEAVSKSGGSRGSGPDVKTIVRLVGHRDALLAWGASPESTTWITDRMRNTARISAPNSPIEVLGSVVGSAEARSDQFTGTVAKLGSLHQSIGQLNAPQTELALGRVSGGVARVVHLLRTNGNILPSDVVSEQDQCQADFLSHILAGELSNYALRQATAGVQQGGLGMRTASQLRSLAFVASRNGVRPFVANIFGAMAEAGVRIRGCLGLYDQQTAAALDDFTADLDPARADSARERCGACASSHREV